VKGCCLAFFVGLALLTVLAFTNDPKIKAVIVIMYFIKRRKVQ
jgi:hypothetical protein